MPAAAAAPPLPPLHPVRDCGREERILGVGRRATDGSMLRTDERRKADAVNPTVNVAEIIAYN